MTLSEQSLSDKTGTHAVRAARAFGEKKMKTSAATAKSRNVSRMARLTLSGASLLLLLLAFGVSRAATLLVTTTADPGSGTCNTSSGCALRDAISNAAPNDTIEFAIPSTDPGCVSPGVCTIVLDQSAGQLLITNNVTIDGVGQNITLDGSSRQRLLLNAGAVVNINSLTFANAYCEGDVCPGALGGAAIINFGTLTVTNSSFSGNSVGYSDPFVSPAGIYGRDAYGGSAIYSEGVGAVVSIANSTFTGNSGPGTGGAIFDAGDSLSITDSTFSGNSGGSGGAVGSFGTAASIKNSTFSGNSGEDGGAVAVFSGTLTVTNSTFSGNSSVVAGAVHNLYGATTITNSTLAGNVAPQGGEVANETGTLILNNTIVANSSGSGNCAAAGTLTRGGPITDGGGNLSDDSSCGFQTTSLSGANPNLGPLQNNGGPTQTLALLAGSPAIALGVPANCPATDQRGAARPGLGQNCSSGAFQYVAPAQLKVAPSNVSFGRVPLFRLRTTTVTVTNTGTVPVSISNVSVTSGTRASSREFLALSLCPPSLAVHSICKIAVAFFAQDLGPQSATLKIASNAAGSPLSIPLSARVVP